MSEGRKRRIGGYRFDVIVLLLFVGLLLVDKLWFSRVSYISGLKGGSSDDFMAMLLFLPLCGVFVGLIVIALVRLILAIVKICRGRGAGWVRLLLCIAPFVVSIGLFIRTGEEGAGATYFLRGYEKWVQKEVDVAAIRKWLTSLDSDFSEKRYFEIEDFPEDFPEAIKKLEVQYMYFSKFDGEQRSVEFEWGGAMGHWGIYIGPPGMETPEEGHVELSESTWEYQRPVQPGVYVFDRG
jgi:hypothetical protein